MNQYIVITGGSKGIGKALALLLSRQDDLTILIAGRSLEALKETQATSPNKIHIVQADIGTEEGRNTILNALPKQSKINCLVHNAAVVEGCELKNIKLEDWRYQIAVNLEGPIFLTQLLLPKLNNNSRVLHISSGFAHVASHGLGTYCISKAALYMAYKCLAAELSTLNIYVGSLDPGIVDTAMQEKLRSMPIEVFPSLPQFQAFPQEKKLSSPLKIACFIKWVLFATDNKKFIEEEWNIADTWHHQYWLNNDENF